MGFFRDLISDDNSINEKSFVGFIAVFCMAISLLVDLLSGYYGKKLMLNQYIFDGFLLLSVGSFGIASVDKFINRKNPQESSKASENTNQTEG